MNQPPTLYVIEIWNGSKLLHSCPGFPRFIRWENVFKEIEGGLKRGQPFDRIVWIPTT